MRRVTITRGDFALFHQDINPVDYEFFRNHAGAFKRMWSEQTRQFWSVFVDMFDHFIWKYGVMKDFPLKIDDIRKHIDEIISLIQINFVDGNATSAKSFVNECAIVAQNRHYIAGLDKAPYSQNPFYIKDTRETFRKLFGPPKSKATFMKVLCGLPVYIKFAGAVVTSLRRWLKSEDIDDLCDKERYFQQLTQIRSEDKSALDAIERTIIKEKKKEESDGPTKRVSKKHFALESTKQKAKEWAESTGDIALDLEELDPPREKASYKSEYKKAIQSVTEDVKNSLVESIAEAKKKEIEAAQERGEDIEPILEDIKASFGKKKRQRKKKRKPTSDEEPTSSHSTKQVSASDKLLEGSVVRSDIKSVPEDTLNMGCSHREKETVSDKEIVTNEVPVSKEEKSKEESNELNAATEECSSVPDDKTDSTSEESLDIDSLFTATKDELPIESEVTNDGSQAKRKLHVCWYCQKKEEIAKSFKRCVKCRGKPHPRYYCSKDCQVNDWKAGHRLDHKDDSE